MNVGIKQLGSIGLDLEDGPDTSTYLTAEVLCYTENVIMISYAYNVHKTVSTFL